MNNQALKELAERLDNYDSCHGARLTDLSDLFKDYSEVLYRYIDKGYKDDAKNALCRLMSLFDVILEQTPESLFVDLESLIFELKHLNNLK